LDLIYIIGDSVGVLWLNMQISFSIAMVSSDIKGFINNFKSFLNVVSWFVRLNLIELQELSCLEEVVVWLEVFCGIGGKSVELICGLSL